jgi:hypothetical protein
MSDARVDQRNVVPLELRIGRDYTVAQPVLVLNWFEELNRRVPRR